MEHKIETQDDKPDEQTLPSVSRRSALKATAVGVGAATVGTASTGSVSAQYSGITSGVLQAAELGGFGVTGSIASSVGIRVNDYLSQLSQDEVDQLKKEATEVDKAEIRAEIYAVADSVRQMRKTGLDGREFSLNFEVSDIGTGTPTVTKDTPGSTSYANTVWSEIRGTSATSITSGDSIEVAVAKATDAARRSHMAASMDGLGAANQSINALDQALIKNGKTGVDIVRMGGESVVGASAVPAGTEVVAEDLNGDPVSIAAPLVAQAGYPSPKTFDEFGNEQIKMRLVHTATSGWIPAAPDSLYPLEFGPEVDTTNFALSPASMRVDDPNSDNTITPHLSEEFVAAAEQIDAYQTQVESGEITTFVENLHANKSTLDLADILGAREISKKFSDLSFGRLAAELTASGLNAPDSGAMATQVIAAHGDPVNRNVLKGATDLTQQQNFSSVFATPSYGTVPRVARYSGFPLTVTASDGTIYTISTVVDTEYLNGWIHVYRVDTDGTVTDLVRRASRATTDSASYPNQYGLILEEEKSQLYMLSSGSSNSDSVNVRKIDLNHSSFPYDGGNSDYAPRVKGGANSVAPLDYSTDGKGIGQRDLISFPTTDGPGSRAFFEKGSVTNTAPFTVDNTTRTRGNFTAQVSGGARTNSTRPDATAYDAVSQTFGMVRGSVLEIYDTDSFNGITQPRNTVDLAANADYAVSQAPAAGPTVAGMVPCQGSIFIFRRVGSTDGDKIVLIEVNPNDITAPVSSEFVDMAGEFNITVNNLKTTENLGENLGDENPFIGVTVSDKPNLTSPESVNDYSVAPSGTGTNNPLMIDVNEGTVVQRYDGTGLDEIRLVDTPDGRRITVSDHPTVQFYTPPETLSNKSGAETVEGHLFVDAVDTGVGKTVTSGTTYSTSEYRAAVMGVLDADTDELKPRILNSSDGPLTIKKVITDVDESGVNSETPDSADTQSADGTDLTTTNYIRIPEPSTTATIESVIRNDYIIELVDSTGATVLKKSAETVEQVQSDPKAYGLPVEGSFSGVSVVFRPGFETEAKTTAVKDPTDTSKQKERNQKQKDIDDEAEQAEDKYQETLAGGAGGSGGFGLDNPLVLGLASATGVLFLLQLISSR